jgi:hypothetical protein
MSKQIVPLHKIVRNLDANKFVVLNATFEAIKLEREFSFVVTDNAPLRQNVKRTTRQRANTTMAFLPL